MPIIQLLRITALLLFVILMSATGRSAAIIDKIYHQGLLPSFLGSNASPQAAQSSKIQIVHTI